MDYASRTQNVSTSKQRITKFFRFTDRFGFSVHSLISSFDPSERVKKSSSNSEICQYSVFMNAS